MNREFAWIGTWIFNIIIKIAVSSTLLSIIIFYLFFDAIDALNVDESIGETVAPLSSITIFNLHFSWEFLQFCVWKNINDTLRLRIASMDFTIVYYNTRVTKY